MFILFTLFTERDERRNNSMIDYDKIKEIERNQIKDICFQMEESYRQLHPYNYFISKTDVRAALMIVAIQNVEKKLDELTAEIKKSNKGD